MSESSAKNRCRQLYAKSWRGVLLDTAAVLSGLGGLVVFIEWILGRAS